MMHLYEDLKDEAFKLIDMKGTVDDVKAGEDLGKIEQMYNSANNTQEYISNACKLDNYLRGKYKEIERLCETGTAMQKVLGIFNNNEKASSSLEQVQSNLVTDYFGILAGVLLKHEVISHIKEFIKSVD
ncbi:MAG: hypothetical protein NC225_07850 [Clostridium sp.]|nr:hypothetical protein [Clostridium sp.]MCM1460582.1 hypothetical protein [Bacteroides sp.]